MSAPRAIGEGANLGVTQAGRIAFAERGGRINTDFIDNSAGVDCSDNEVNIKIPLNREMAEGRLGFDDRNAFLAEHDRRCRRDRARGQPPADAGAVARRAWRRRRAAGAGARDRDARSVGPRRSRGRGARKLATSCCAARRTTRASPAPSWRSCSSHGKLALQAAIERTDLAADPTLTPLLHAAFPPAMRERFGEAIDRHRLRGEIIATKMANRVVNRLGVVIPFELAEEEGISLAQVAATYFAADAIFGLEDDLDADRAGAGRPRMRGWRCSTPTAASVRLHMADLLRAATPEMNAGEIAAAARRRASAGSMRRPRGCCGRRRRRRPIALRDAPRRDRRRPADLVERIVRLNELDGAVGTAALARRLGVDEITATHAYVRLGEALGLDWAKAAAARFASSDPWERLLTAGLARDFEQLRLDFVARAGGKDPLGAVEAWLTAQRPRVAQFRALVDRARTAPATDRGDARADRRAGAGAAGAVGAGTLPPSSSRRRRGSISEVAIGSQCCASGFPPSRE